MPASEVVLALAAQSARELMTREPMAICDAATVAEAIALFTDKGFSAMPVVDGSGKPVGVVSRGDLLAHDREWLAHLRNRGSVTSAAGEPADTARVRDVMTPIVFSVAPATPSQRVIQDMVANSVNRLFVVENGRIVGVITTLDVLRRFRF